MKTGFTLLFIAAFSISTWAWAQNDAHPPAGAACPAAAEVDSPHLFGRWQAQVQAGAGSAPQQATLTLRRNPEFSGSLSGTITRDTGTNQVAGDVDNGVFTLEESGDGKTIAATWTGQITEGSCGREIRGVWKNVLDQSQHDFILRQQASMP